ncbi:MAG TPA: AlkA N-terminal domain-containing protein [Caulobacteraceae bacterium]|jgi:AraC family transcriptional regulator of adaptative response / DNA-3-methyladenine glycosylase II|nr:AlkA N-terminal domain-containing protein [Caulobacteraceae bacterium]
MLDLDPDHCYRILQTRDPRFDGRIFVGVTSTGIYCRPICPARTPKPEHCRFFPTAAAAQARGFRPCLRCRPETAPGQGAWRGASSTVSRAMRLIAEGGLDEDASVGDLAGCLGVGERQLRRLFRQHLGASPVAIAQNRRVHFAKQLIHETRLPMAEVALASGFGSVRRFNDTFAKLFKRPPGELRRIGQRDPADAAAPVTLRLTYRGPYDWPAMLGFLGARAIAGVEVGEADRYRRVVRIGETVGRIEVSHLAARRCLVAAIRCPDVRALPAIVTRLRALFDLDADLDVIGVHLARDPRLAPLVARRPGLRVPGCWDGFELAVRAILGQQITLQGGRTLAGRLTAACGTRLEGEGALSHAFPTPRQLADGDLGMVGLTTARAAALKALAGAALADPRLFEPAASLDEAVARFRALPGVGEWTAQYIALRALREADAFPAADIGLMQGHAAEGEPRPTPKQLLQHAEAWRPWRAYAAQHLWAAYAARKPGKSKAA